MSNHSPLPETRRLYQQVADQIRQLIADKGIGVGGRLPPERDLAQQIGVSRPSLREALIALEIEGTVDIRMGSGIYFLGSGGVPTKPHGDSPSELMEARLALETASIGLACARAAPEGLQKLKAILDQMEQEIAAGQTPLDNDRRFHMEIATLSGNAILVRLVGELFDARFSPLLAQFRKHFETGDAWREAFREHSRILEALTARDTLRCVGEMSAHLLASRRRWEGEG